MAEDAQPRLILLNGLPGNGKSTLAHRFVADHPLALCLDVDLVRGMLGGWLDQPSTAGHFARQIALAMARVALGEGQDVIVPQFLARSEFIDDLGTLAAEIGARFLEVVLLDDPEQITERLAHRAANPSSQIHRDAHVLLERSGGLEQVPDLHRRLLAVVADRPATLVVTPIAGKVERTYQDLLGQL